MDNRVLPSSVPGIWQALINSIDAEAIFISPFQGGRQCRCEALGSATSFPGLESQCCGF